MSDKGNLSYIYELPIAYYNTELKKSFSSKALQLFFINTLPFQGFFPSTLNLVWFMRMMLNFHSAAVL